jgi:hypothetical protein
MAGLGEIGTSRVPMSSMSDQLVLALYSVTFVNLQKFPDSFTRTFRPRSWVIVQILYL